MFVQCHLVKIAVDLLSVLLAYGLESLQLEIMEIKMRNVIKYNKRGGWRGGLFLIDTLQTV